MPADDDDTLLPFSLPSICKKKVTAAFDGGTISSDGGVFLLEAADRRIGLIDRLAALFPDSRDPSQVTHSMADLLRERVFAIACGYPDGNDLDDLRTDPAFKMACGRLPDSGADLASQPTISRLENAPDLRDLIRICSGGENIQLFIRLHPHVRKKSREDQLRWLALGEIKGVNIVSFDSDVDTYALIDQSDVVVTAGSTVGIEAVFWRRPSITLGPSYYSELGVTLHPRSSAELKAMLASDKLPVERERTIPYGYYMSTFGTKFLHYVPETLFKGKFMGVDLHGVTEKRLKWLRLKQIATKPIRALSKLSGKLSGSTHKPTH